MRAARPSTALLALGLLAATASADVPDVSSVLDDFVRAETPAYAWSERGQEELAGGSVLHRLSLTSQVWKGREWQHRLNVIVPPAATGERARPGHAVLLITGSGGEDQVIQLVQGLAAHIGVPVAILHDVPNQPLFEAEVGRGLREDAAIAYTFVKYIETGDTDWPLLLPMTRAAVRGMDALGEWSAGQGEAWAFGRLERFVTTGASKRGWTTWLTGVAEAERVIGIAPIVYDNLNIRAQIQHHFRVWGKPSRSIGDYTEAGLVRFLEDPTPQAESLLEIVDPYVYSSRLDIPKLALLGTNDSYWPVDAVNLYRGGLPGDLYTHYVPNAGHRAGISVVWAVGGFFDAVVGRIPRLPTVALSVMPGERRARLQLGADYDLDRVAGAKLWGAHVAAAADEATRRDFREARWVAAEGRRQGGAWEAVFPEATVADAGHTAFLAEVEFADSNGGTFSLHSPVQVWGVGPAEKK